jgi:hypothetical protein
VIGALFDPSAFASGEPVTTDAGFADWLAGDFVCRRADTPEIAANATTKIRIPIRLMGSSFTRCSPKVSRSRYSNPILVCPALIDVKLVDMVIPKAK